MPPYIAQIAEVLGWTLVHSVWQIALIWIVFRLLVWRLSTRNIVIYHLALSREARARREFACDDWVLQQTANPLLYARTLTELQRTFSNTTNMFLMNATGNYRFTDRIMRIFGIAPQQNMRSVWLSAILFPLLIGALAKWPVRNATPAPDTPASFTVVLPQTTPTRSSAPSKRKPTALRRDTLAPELVAVEAVKMNLLYVGVDNPLRIAAAGVPANDIYVKLREQGEVKGDKGLFYVRVFQPGVATIAVYRKKDGKEVLLSEQKYRVKRIPDPMAILDIGYTGGSMSKEQLLTSKGLTTLLPNCDFDVKCSVTGFEYTVVPAKSNPLPRGEVKGAAFPADMRRQIEDLKEPGSVVFVDNIMVNCPGDRYSRPVGSLAFKIK